MRVCVYAGTDARGRVQANVRHVLLYIMLDVPTTDQLLAWAQAAYKPLAGHITFFETNRCPARETVSFAAGQLCFLKPVPAARLLVAVLLPKLRRVLAKSSQRSPLKV